MQKKDGNHSVQGQRFRHCLSFQKGGLGNSGSWIIEQGLEKNQIGAWSRDYDIVGGTYYGFEALGLGTGLSNQRANSYVEIFFHDRNRQLVIDERTGNFSRPFYPWGEEQENGWIKFKGVFRAPNEAKSATIRLFLRWEPRARIEWSNIQFINVLSRSLGKYELEQ